MVTAARADSGSKKRIRTGVAISPTAIRAADIRLRSSASRAWLAPLDSPPTDGSVWSSLASALDDLARALGASEGVLSISLMPPLTEVRRLELPPLAEEDLQRLLSRNASRYFVNARTPQIVGASSSKRRARGKPSPVVAAAASTRLVASVRAAAEQAGWTVDSIAPAESAWAAGAIALWPAFAKQDSYALVAHEDRTDLLQIEDGRLTGVRRFRAGGADASMIADAVGPTARIGVAGSSGERRAISAALAAVNVTTSTPSGEWSAAAEDADVMAAQFAGTDVGPTLRTEGAVAADKASARKMTLIIAGAAAALFLAAAGIQLWGVHHQLALVRAERAKLKPQLSSTLVGRTTVDATYRHLAALATSERNAPRWSSVIAALSESVPEDAHLTAIRARSDSLIVDGLAQHAARVFDALEKTHGLVEVKAASPVRRELQDGGSTLDHFVIGARVVKPSPLEAATTTASTRKGGGQ